MNHAKAKDLPKWLYNLYEIVRAAYPDGVPNELYYAFIAVVRLPQGSLAEFVSFVFEEDYHVVADDILKVQTTPGGPGSVKPSEEQIRRVMDSLLSWGFYDWQQTYDG